MIATRARRRGLGVLAGAALIALAPAAASAESLEDALALAYGSNPSLAAQRASVRSSDEGFIQARSQALPSVSASVSAGTSNSRRSGIDPGLGLPPGIGGASNTHTDSLRYTLSISQNLWRGGRTGAAMDQAMANIMAARAQLASTEQSVLVDAVSAYMNVRRDEAILSIRANNVQVLERQLQASQDRFEVGEITRTDVSQAEARLAGARSEYAAAQSTLTASRAAYERVVGQAPGTLDPEPPLPPLPEGLDDALDLALDHNPDVAAATYNEQAASASVRSAKGAMYPSLSLSADVNHGDSYASGPLKFEGYDTQSDSTSVTGRLSIPLFSGNTLSSSVRQARENESRARLQLRDTQRRARESVSTAWSNYIAAQSQTQSSSEQVRANELAYEGVEAEAAVGLRTTLDVLNAEQELLNSRVALAQAQRNAYVAGFAVLQSIGAVTPETLNLDVEVYDPSDNLSRVRRQYLGIGVLE